VSVSVEQLAPDGGTVRVHGEGVGVVSDKAETAVGRKEAQDKAVAADG
jgi:hypothetical protein